MKNNKRKMIMKNNECVGFFGKMFGHKFRARYNKKTEPGTSIENWLGSTKLFAFPIDINKAVVDLQKKETTYIGEVCERCGKIINKEDKIK